MDYREVLDAIDAPAAVIEPAPDDPGAVRVVDVNRAATALGLRAGGSLRDSSIDLAALNRGLRAPLESILHWSRALVSGGVPIQDLGRALDTIVRSAEAQQAFLETTLGGTPGRVEPPASGPPQETIAKPTLPAPGPLAGRKVLVVEDNASTRDVMQWTLEREGAEVVAVGSGAEALVRFDAANQVERDFEVMLCDIGLPGMSGYELIQSLVAKRRAQGRAPLPACAVSAHARETDRQRALSSGFGRYLEKPVSADALVRAVKELAERSDSPSATNG